MSKAETDFKASRNNLAFSQQLMEQRMSRSQMMPEEAPQQPETGSEQPQEAPMQEEAQEETGVVQDVLEGVKGLLSDFMEKFTKKEEEPKNVVLKQDATIAPKED